MSKKVVTLGEIMLRLSTPDFKRFVQADTFDITYGGGEANVAAALCNYGLNGTFVTKVPNNPIGPSAINHLRRLFLLLHPDNFLTPRECTDAAS